MARHARGRIWLGIGLALLLLVGAAVAFAGSLARPFVESALSDALHRPVSIGRLHLSLGRSITATAEDVVIGNPPDFPAEATPWFARIPRLVAVVDPMAWLRDGRLVVPRLELEQPQVEARGLEDGRVNYLFPGPLPQGEAAPPGSAPEIGALVIRDGRAHAVLAPLAADFEVTLATVDPAGEAPTLAGEAAGTYAGQPVTARFTGGAVLALQEADRPWPLRLEIANGPTRLQLEGTVREPLALRGADLRLEAAGPDLGLLRPISGIAFPATPPFRLAGQFDYVAGRVRLLRAEGVIGRTDVAGGIIVTLGGVRPVLAAELRSRRVDLRDLGGFIGAEPGRPGDPGLTAERRRALREQAADPFLLPRAPLNLPKLLAADVHVDFTADRIEGRRMPFDALVTQFDIVEGVVDVKRLVFPIGDGQLAARFTLAPAGGEALHARGEIELRRVNFARLVRAAGVQGSGRLGGVGRIEGTGRSVAEILAKGEGSLTAVMVGGTLSAFLVDLSGLRFAKALLSLLGLPERERVECLIGDFGLRRGALEARTLLVDTDSAVITGGGRVAVATERLDLRIRTQSKQPTIGALPTPIAITGTLADPSVAPEAGELAARAGAAAGLAALLPPLALLPTIQLGVGENSQCEALQAQRRRSGQ